MVRPPNELPQLAACSIIGGFFGVGRAAGGGNGRRPRGNARGGGINRLSGKSYKAICLRELAHLCVADSGPKYPRRLWFSDPALKVLRCAEPAIRHAWAQCKTGDGRYYRKTTAGTFCDLVRRRFDFSRRSVDQPIQGSNNSQQSNPSGEKCAANAESEYKGGSPGNWRAGFWRRLAGVGVMVTVSGAQAVPGVPRRIGGSPAGRAKLDLASPGFALPRDEDAELGKSASPRFS